ncbi:hypothetical protein ACFV98_02635 [Streptomyces violascens]|uniref:hypothetical protein n=1 Tax=Streptomyces violascens TaxID=67381 RepID=UPI00364E9F53
MKRTATGSIELGRWSAGTWTTETSGIWFAIGCFHGRGTKPYGIGGPAITLGRRTWAVFPTCSRAEYKERKQDPWAMESEEFQPLPRQRRWPW